MTRSRFVRRLVMISLLVATGFAVRAHAQPPSVPPPTVTAPPKGGAYVPEPTVNTQVIAEQDVRERRYLRSIVRIAQDLTLGEQEVARETTVIFGNATIRGRVERDVVVVFGNAELSDTSVIEGSLTVVGGNVVARPGAVLQESLAVIGGTLDAPPDFGSGYEHVIIGIDMLGGRLRAVYPWLTRGALWLRPIVPELPWVWLIVGIFILTYLVLSLVFDGPVSICATTVAGRPFSAFMVGLVTLALVGPVCVLLTVTLIGFVAVPFVLMAVFAAWVIGKIGVMRALGMRILPQSAEDNKLESLRSFAIGVILITLAYMVPVLGFATWMLVGIFGLGSAVLAFLKAYRRENPVPVPPVQPVPTPPMPPPPTPVAYTQPMTAPYQYGETTMPQAEPSTADFTQSPTGASAAVLRDLTMFPRATLLDRLAAAFLDIILVVMASQFLDRIIRDDAVFLLLLAYHVGFLVWKGTTLGGIICQLRVVRLDGAPIRFIDALVRGLTSFFSAVVLGLGFFSIVKDPEGQAWHDKIAGTYVVKVPRNFPL